MHVQPAGPIGLIANRPAPPHRNASRQLKSCKMPGTAKTKHTSSASKRVIGAAYRTDGFATTRTNPQAAPTSARSQLVRQGAVKRDGIDLLVMPSKLNGRLPTRWLRSVDPLRGLEKPRNPTSRDTRRGPTSRGTRQRSAGRPEPRRRPCCRRRSWRSGRRARESSRRAPPGRQA